MPHNALWGDYGRIPDPCNLRMPEPAGGGMSVETGERARFPESMCNRADADQGGISVLFGRRRGGYSYGESKHSNQALATPVLSV